MFQELLSRGQEILDSMTPVAWAIAVVLGLVLVVAIVQQLAKTALVVVLLIGVGLFLLHGHVERWSF